MIEEFINEKSTNTREKEIERELLLDPSELEQILIQTLSITSTYLYEGCLLYFGIREQKQILFIENRFIVFQNPH